MERGEIYYSHGESNKRGVAILFREGVEIKVNGVERDKQGRYLILNTIIKDLEVTICNIYGPNDDDPKFFESLWDIINNFDTNSIIWGGDFNVVLNLQLDKRGAG